MGSEKMGTSGIGRSSKSRALRALAGVGPGIHVGSTCPILGSSENQVFFGENRPLKLQRTKELSSRSKAPDQLGVALSLGGCPIKNQLPTNGSPFLLMATGGLGVVPWVDLSFKPPPASETTGAAAAGPLFSVRRAWRSWRSCAATAISPRGRGGTEPSASPKLKTWETIDYGYAQVNHAKVSYVQDLQKNQGKPERLLRCLRWEMNRMIPLLKGGEMGFVHP